MRIHASPSALSWGPGPGLVWSGPGPDWFSFVQLTAPYLCLRAPQVLHRWVLWNRHSDRLHPDRHAGEPQTGLVLFWSWSQRWVTEI